jgi:hypothetical protein
LTQSARQLIVAADGLENIHNHPLFHYSFDFELVLQAAQFGLYVAVLIVSAQLNILKYYFTKHQQQ